MEKYIPVLIEIILGAEISNIVSIFIYMIFDLEGYENCLKLAVLCGTIFILFFCCIAAFMLKNIGGI